MSYQYEYGSGTEEDPYQVWTAADLDGVRDHAESYFIQMADIDLSEWGGWTPIGDDRYGQAPTWTTFSGQYNGNNYKILGMTIQDINYAGLFSWVENASIKNVYLFNYSIKSSTYSVWGGAITHAAYNTEFNNCHTQGEINICEWAGGITGQSEGCDFFQCSATVKISTNIFGGGISGQCFAPPNTFKQCYAQGIINARSAIGFNSQPRLIGGMVGEFQFYEQNILEDCYTRVDIIDDFGSGWNIAGFIGLASGEDGVIKNCYSTGIVPYTSNAGGFIASGGNYQSIINSYYDSETSGQSDTDSATPKTTAQMIYPYSDPENVYVDWNFEEIWYHDKQHTKNDGYPMFEPVEPPMVSRYIRCWMETPQTPIPWRFVKALRGAQVVEE